jgi:hypothetical protein
VKRWLLTGLIMAGLAASVLWLPHPEENAEAVAESPEVSAEPVPEAVELLATRGTATPPYVEKWDLVYPDTPPAAQRLILSIGAAEPGMPVPARLTAVVGDASGLLSRAAAVLGADVDERTPQPSVQALDLQLTPLGEKLSAGSGQIGATVIAGAFVAQPAGDWRAYRVAFGDGGPQCFLGISESTRHAVLLARDANDGTAILKRLRGLLGPRPAAS